MGEAGLRRGSGVTCRCLPRASAALPRTTWSACRASRTMSAPSVADIHRARTTISASGPSSSIATTLPSRLRWSGGSSMRRQRGGVLDGAAAACRESSTPRERVGRARCPGRGGHARSSLRPNSARLVVVLSGPRGGPTAPAWRWRRSKHGAAGSRASATARTAGGRVLPGQATGPDAMASRSTAAWHGAACSCASFHPPSRRTATPVRRTRRPWSPNRS
jgi:hypothetical protein